MPEWLHKQLARSARKQGLKGDRFNAYVYSVLNKYKKAHTGKEVKKKRKKGKLAKP